MTIDSVNTIIAAAAGVSIGVMAILLLTVAMPRDKKFAAYRTSRYILAAGYLLLSAVCVFSVYMRLPFSGKVDSRTLTITLSAAALQGVMFQYTILALINPMRLTLRYVMNSLVPVVAVVTVLVGTYLWGGQKLWIIVFHVACGLYFLLIAVHERLFKREYRDYVVIIKNHFADDNGLHLKWISRAYYLVVSLGTAAGISLFLPAVPFMFIIGLIAIFYVYYAIRYIGYARVFPRTAPALEPVFDEVGGHRAGHDEMPSKIGEWIACKKFSRPGITFDSVSEELDLPRMELAMYIRSHGGRSFSRWINELRVEEAREVMITCRDMPLKEVAARTGFSSLRAFIRSFESVEGERPRYFQERIRFR